MFILSGQCHAVPPHGPAALFEDKSAPLTLQGCPLPFTRCQSLCGLLCTHLKLPSYNSAPRAEIVALALHMRKLKLSGVKYKRTPHLYSRFPELRLHFLLPPLGANAARFLTLGLSDTEASAPGLPSQPVLTSLLTPAGCPLWLILCSMSANGSLSTPRH